MTSVIDAVQCASCGASVASDAEKCLYCGVWLIDSRDTSEHLQVLDKNAGEFGIPGNKPLWVAILGAAVLYALGWLFEDTRYWLATEAVVIWAAAIPLWLCLVAVLWRAKHSTWLWGFAIALPILLMHVTMMWIIRGSINDDLVGIAALFSGAALVGWLVGRLVHQLARNARAKAIN